MHAWTTLAIQRFETLLKKEHQLQKATDKLTKAMKLIPTADLPEYYKATSELTNKYEQKYGDELK